MKTIKISKGIKDALVDDDDYDRLAEHNWFFDQTQIYTKLSFVSDKTVGASTFALKVRMDFFIFNYAPTINARIRHIDRDPYNCQRENLKVEVKDKGTTHYRRTIYLGVIETPTRVKTKYSEKDNYLLLFTEGFCGDESQIYDGGINMRKLAERYDERIRHINGNETRTNFLMYPIQHQKENL